MEPADRIRGKSSNDLAGKRIILGITGSIGAVKTVEIARELIRHGAHVVPVMTRGAQGILTADALRFATGEDPVVQLTGKVEHVSELGAAGDADLLLVAPATANTIAKMALGIDDTPVTTFATVALGAERPVLVAPAMHGVMEEHPRIQDHLATLQEMGVTIVRPKREEGKAKLAEKETVLAACARALGPRDLAGKRVLVITGAARAPIDPVRMISNRSSGKMGQAIVHEADRRGAHVTVWTAPTTLPFHTEGTTWTYPTMDELTARVHALEPGAFDLVLVPAALIDHAPRPEATKRSSDVPTQTLELERVPKVLGALRERLSDATLVGWKLQDTLDEAITAARQRIERGEADLFVANGRDTLDQQDTHSVILTKDDQGPVTGSKKTVARCIFDHARRRVQEANA